MRDIIILGTGGNCLDLLDLIEVVDRADGGALFRCAGFLDDDPARQGTDFHGFKVLGPLASARSRSVVGDALFLNGIGSPASYLRKPDILASTGLAPERFVTLAHPAASVSRHARLGRGVALFPGVFVGHGAVIGDHVIALSGAVISHDAEVGDYTCIASGASVSGGVRIGAGSYLGTNCSIAGGLTVGRKALVGMGAVVIRDVPEETVVAGNPARELRKAG